MRTEPLFEYVHLRKGRDRRTRMRISAAAAGLVIFLVLALLCALGIITPESLGTWLKMILLI